MAKTSYTSVDHYIASQPDPVQPILERVRAIIKKTLPRAAEVISYQIPAYKVDDAAVIYFAGWAKHFSLYPLGRVVPVVLKKEIARYPLGRGTIRFPLDEPVPVKLITRIVKLRAKEEAAKRSKTGSARSRR